MITLYRLQLSSCQIDVNLKTANSNFYSVKIVVDEGSNSNFSKIDVNLETANSNFFSVKILVEVCCRRFDLAPICLVPSMTMAGSSTKTQSGKASSALRSRTSTPRDLNKITENFTFLQRTKLKTTRNVCFGLGLVLSEKSYPVNLSIN